jgi:hypothetical protein
MSRYQKEFKEPLPSHTSLWLVYLMLSQKDLQNKPYHCRKVSQIRKKQGRLIFKQLLADRQHAIRKNADVTKQTQFQSIASKLYDIAQWTNSQANDERRRNGSFRRSVCVKLLVNWN